MRQNPLMFPRIAPQFAVKNNQTPPDKSRGMRRIASRVR